MTDMNMTLHKNRQLQQKNISNSIESDAKLCDNITNLIIAKTIAAMYTPFLKLIIKAF
jgi:hypothetical protein